MRASHWLFPIMASGLLVACGGGDSTDQDNSNPGEPVEAGVGGNSTAGSGGAAAGNAGAAGEAGSAGAGAKGGAAGNAGSGTGGASGAAGNTNQGGSAGMAGTAGQGGDSGAAGDAGAGQGGDSGAAGEGGSAQGGNSGAAGQGGDAGAAGAAGNGGQAGEAGSAGTGGSGGVPCSQDPSVGQPCTVDGQVGACALGSYACDASDVRYCKATGASSPETCDSVDNDCNGVVDDGIADLTCGQGQCFHQVKACEGGIPQTCTPLASSSEICDNVDNDCNGAIDDGLQDLTCGKGQCFNSVQACIDGNPQTCTPFPPTDEVCDGLDNDCNGLADDGIADLTCGLGECVNTVKACLAGVPQACLPLQSSAELCDGKDNDCDGASDEDNVCCPEEQRCGQACCAVSETCSFQHCELPGVTCYGAEDCPMGHYCEFTLGTVTQPPPQCTGSTQKTGRCLPKPPVCPDGVEPGNPPTCLVKCEYKAPAPSFQPTLKYSWGGQTSSPFATDVMMTPIVVQLDDDDCDGKVTERDIPDILFSTFSSGAYNTNGALHAISIMHDQVVDKWSITSDVHATKQLAGANLDGVSGSEVVVCGLSGNVRAIRPNGTQLWSTATPACFMPSIADLDGDGQPEVITEGGIYVGATGALKASFTPALGAPFVVSDIDSDGKLDIVTSGKAYRGNGTLIVDTGLAATSSFPDTGDWKGPWAAVADFNQDGKPEVIGLDNVNHSLVVWRYNAAIPAKYEVVRSPIDINGSLNPSLCPVGSWGNTHGGGSLTVGDFNNDSTPDIAFAGGVGYAVIDGNKLINPAYTGLQTFLWARQTSDCSSASTGSSLFDFNGDGSAEVIYSDEYRLRIYEGATGNVLFETCNTTATLAENPIVADVDNDGQADIIMPSNAYAKECNTAEEAGQRKSGIRVFGSASGSWVRTRRVWNQHAYHVTNINEDGTVPAQELPNWTQPGLNNFRQNKQPAGQFSAPDLVVWLRPACEKPWVLTATVRNLGEAAVEAGVKVAFYTSDGTKIGEGVTTTPLYPAEAEDVELPLLVIPSMDVYAVVDDGNPPHSWHECRTDNNKSNVVGPLCLH